MPAPTILDALAEMQTRFTGINGVSPYYTTVVTVEQRGLIWAQVDDSARPYIGIQLMGAENREAMARQVFETFDVILVCHLDYDADPRARIVAQMELLDDIYTALDTGTGGYSLNRTCSGLKVTKWLVDAGDPLAVNTIKIYIQLQTRRTPGAS